MAANRKKLRMSYKDVWKWWTHKFPSATCAPKQLLIFEIQDHLYWHPNLNSLEVGEQAIVICSQGQASSGSSGSDGEEGKGQGAQSWLSTLTGKPFVFKKMAQLCRMLITCDHWEMFYTYVPHHKADRFYTLRRILLGRPTLVEKRSCCNSAAKKLLCQFGLPLGWYKPPDCKCVPQSFCQDPCFWF